MGDMEPTAHVIDGMSDSLDQLAPALVRLQGAVKNPLASQTLDTRTQDKETGRSKGFTAKFAPLDEIIDLTKPALAEHGFALIQQPTGTGKTVRVKTLLLHESGQWLSWTTELDSGIGAQAQGGAITYARRYAQLGAFNIFNDTDGDDGGKRAQEAVERRQRSDAQRASAERQRAERASSAPAQRPSASEQQRARQAPAEGSSAVGEAGNVAATRGQRPPGARRADPATGERVVNPSKARDYNEQMVAGFREVADERGLNKAALVLLARQIEKRMGQSPEKVTCIEDLGRPVFAPFTAALADELEKMPVTNPSPSSAVDPHDAGV